MVQAKANSGSKRQQRRSAFTVVEMMVAVLIIGLLMSIALPLYLSAQSDANKKQCHGNMQTIAAAVQAAYLTNLYPNYSTFTGAVSTTKEPALGAVPICPNGGSYTIANGSSGTSTTFEVVCSVDGSFQQGVNTF